MSAAANDPLAREHQPERNAVRNLITFLLLFAVWLLWSGHTEPLLLGLGVASCGLVVWISHHMHVLDDEAYPYQIAVRLLSYVPWVLLQVIKTNLAVARIILSPSLPLRPHLVRMHVRQKTAIGQVIHANTITLTPGTLTLDVRNKTFLVYALTPEAIEESGARELDRRVARLEGQRPSTLPPGPTPPRATQTQKEDE